MNSDYDCRADLQDMYQCSGLLVSETDAARDRIVAYIEQMKTTIEAGKKILPRYCPHVCSLCSSRKKCEYKEFMVEINKIKRKD